MTNLVGSVFQAPPVTGSFSRSAVNAACGVNTLLSQWFAALMVMIALAGGAPAFYYIPQSSLAAMTIVAVANLIDFRVALKLWRSSKEDFLVWLTGFLGVMFFGVEYAGTNSYFPLEEPFVEFVLSPPIELVWLIGLVWGRLSQSLSYFFSCRYPGLGTRSSCTMRSLCYWTA
eukprot:m.345489 g.345489  ORF g.345489 m.345489 type:complete len:173 (-) comp55813_c0_seq14:1988-2506(-)